MEDRAVSESKYRAVHVAARRARQLQSGSSPAVPTRATKAVRIAQDELKAGLIDYIVPEKPSSTDQQLPAGYTPILHT
jgi:DNA-directed RNA polymerase subunit omega